MAKNRNNTNDQKPVEPTPGLGLDNSASVYKSDFEQIGMNILNAVVKADTTERNSEDQPPPSGTEKPVTAADLRDTRVTYPAKPSARCGPTVQSLSKKEAGNRTKQSTVLVVCAEHHTPCFGATSNGIYSTYYCPVEGCSRSYKIVTPTVAQKLNERMRRNEQLPHAQQDITPR